MSLATKKCCGEMYITEKETTRIISLLIKSIALFKIHFKEWEYIILKASQGVIKNVIFYLDKSFWKYFLELFYLV